ncbi:L-lactate MFS transporter [Arsenicicoccus sp. oral taxon 190]|uniref:L-lactate MFS transporter n=1 Tax=Arsenicicoccus sp. oral taxon 190 TaxID=1658671 RepID=UPI000679FFBE|nr:OFA family MFS transporter [Arsenicicoccus sp. oral taxon 190]AKT52307.1 MFS transporter [Arsenicicoccus sp. oral taxon 190]
MSSSTTAGAPATTGPNRWLLVLGGVLVQMAIGAIYAWSVFAKALQADASALHLSKSQAAIPFEVAIGMIFVGSFVGGRLQDKRGPRTVALTGVVIYGIGIILSSFAKDAGQLWLLVLGYGLISGFGLGMAYIVPIAMLQKWFPDKAGLITGLAVGGFGFGAVVTAPLATRMIEADPAHPTAPFLWLGIAYLVAGVLGASIFRNPPADYRVAGAPAKDATSTAQATASYSQAEALRMPQWYLLTLILTLSVTAGISLISIAAGSATDIAGYSKIAAGSLVGIMGLFNGAGRIFWAWLSDRIGKMPAFIGILGLQGLALIALPHATSPILFAVLAAVIYTCYGGGFGTMPSTAGKFFGVKHAGGIYGLMLIGWSIGGVAGPLLVAALIGSTKNYTLAYTVVGIIALVGAAIPLITKAPRRD